MDKMEIIDIKNEGRNLGMKATNKKSRSFVVEPY